MKALKIGRVLGIGLRVAGRMAGQRLAAPPQTAVARPAGQAAVAGAAAEVRTAGQAAGHATVQAGRSVSRGVGGFLRPFRRVGGIVWLEVTGVFFLLPVIVFTPIIWQTRADWAQGPEHRKFLSAVLVVAVFLYLGVTAFLRARKRARA